MAGKAPRFFIREEEAGDQATIAALTALAFTGHPHSDGSEPLIIDRLRRQGALAVSLVAVTEDRIAGHVALSPASSSDHASGWYALGPISVAPELQGQGIGSALVRAGLARVKENGARGCILVGAPAYYRRFGFEVTPSCCPPGLPAEYFMVVSFGDRPSGTFAFHPAFFGDAAA